MAGHQAQQTAGAPGNRRRGMQKRWRMGKSNYKEGQHEREFKDEGSSWQKQEQERVIWAKVRGIHKQSKMKRDKILRLYPTILRGKKGKTENRAWKRQARPLPERQKSETVGQTRQLQADTVLQKETLVKTRQRKKAGVFVESWCTGGFEGHIMCLISSGSKSETSLLSVSILLYVVSACLFLSVGILWKLRKLIPSKLSHFSQKRAPHFEKSNPNAPKNPNSSQAKYIQILLTTCHWRFKCTIYLIQWGLCMSLSVSLSSQQSFRKLVGVQCLNPGFLVERNSTYSLHYFPTPHMPHFTTQVGALPSYSTEWSRRLSPDGQGRRVQRQDSPGQELHHQAYHFMF